MTENTDSDKTILCDSCGAVLKLGKLHYILDLKLYASPEIEVHESDFYKDFMEELGKVAVLTSSMNEQEMMEEVCLALKLNLCKKCRDIIAKKIRNKELIK
jgi:hypothetical protein